MLRRLKTRPKMSFSSSAAFARWAAVAAAGASERVEAVEGGRAALDDAAGARAGVQRRL
jgi:hypothetical protein